MPRPPHSALHEASSKLAEYVDRLWVGRESATASLAAVYAERLASAAKMASMIQLRCPVSAVVDLFRHEDRAFPRELLATDAGRDARSAFNAAGRAIRALEEFRLPNGYLPSGPDVIVGAQLSAVSFVQDYLELAFDGPLFAVLCPLEIHTPHGGTAKAGEDGFRDRICEAIGRTVTALAIDDHAASIELGEYRITIDLVAGSVGPEKMLFHDEAGRITVWN